MYREHFIPAIQEGINEIRLKLSHLEECQSVYVANVIAQKIEVMCEQLMQAGVRARLKEERDMIELRKRDEPLCQ